MSIQHVSNQAGTIQSMPANLRPGQIIQGRILKLYPNNKAQIQLGTQTMIAQLEASLTTGENYHFQVQTTGDIIRLKVIGEQLKGKIQDSVMNLLKKLGLKPTKSNMTFVQLLISGRIPFDKEQLLKGFQLLNESKNKVQAQQVLKDMIAKKLPITASIFQALYTKRTSGLSEQMNAMLLQLKQDTNNGAVQQSLKNRLSMMTDLPLSSKGVLIKQIISEINTNNSQFFNLLKASGAIDTSIDFSEWKNQWRNSVEQSNRNNEMLSLQKLPYQLKPEASIQMLEQFTNNRLGNEALELLRKWGKTIRQALNHGSLLSNQEFTKLTQQVEQSLLPLLSGRQEQQITKLLQNNTESLRHLLTIIQTLTSEQSYSHAEHFLTNTKQSDSLLLINPRDQFLAQLRQVLNFAGLSYENQILHEQTPQATVKSMLIQLLHQSDGIINERSQNMLHFINGMQLQSVNESANYIQASLQLPGEKLGLNSDLQLDFEGNKTETGEINPDFCRILFYLNLANLNETVIEMNIQKRTVAITVFNDQHGIDDKAVSLKPVLKEGLKSLDYHLSNVSFKPLKQVEKLKLDSQGEGHIIPRQGVDYRI